MLDLLNDLIFVCGLFSIVGGAMAFDVRAGAIVLGLALVALSTIIQYQKKEPEE